MNVRKNIIRRYDLMDLSTDEFDCVIQALELLSEANSVGSHTAGTLLRELNDDGKMSPQRILSRTSATAAQTTEEALEALDADHPDHEPGVGPLPEDPRPKSGGGTFTRRGR